MDDLVVVKYYLTRHDAGLAQGLLSDGGIYSVIDADDCGGLRQGMSFGRIRLLIPKAHVNKANELLEVLEVPEE